MKTEEETETETETVLIEQICPATCRSAPLPHHTPSRLSKETAGGSKLAGYAAAVPRHNGKVDGPILRRALESAIAILRSHPP